MSNSVTRTRYGQMRLLDQDSIVSRSLELYGEWAQYEIDLLANFIEPGSTVLDIGAFIGTHALAFSSRVGEQGKVISFEPRIEAFTLLSENIGRNHLANVEARQMGVANERSTIRLHRLSPEVANYAGLVLSGNDDHELENDYEVPIVTVDSLQLSSVSLMKIDVEGMEKQVLDGARSTIGRCKPAIFAESNSISSGLLILEWCKANDYGCFGHLTDAFNPHNFKGEAQNIFGNGKELNLLLMPTARELPSQVQRLPPIDDADDIAALLLHKPQYSHDVLRLANRGQGLGLLFPSPERERLEQEAHHLRTEVEAMRHSSAAVAGEANQLRSEVARLQAEHDAMQSKILALTTRTTELTNARNRANVELDVALVELERAKKQVNTVREERDGARAEVLEIRNSRSWQLTAPVRFSSRQLRALLRLFRTH